MIANARIVLAATATLIALVVPTPARTAGTRPVVPCSTLLSVRAADGRVPSADQLERTLLIERKRMKVEGIRATAYATKSDQICVTLQTARPYNKSIFTQIGKVAFKIRPAGPTFTSSGDRPLSGASVQSFAEEPLLVIEFADPAAYNRFIRQYLGRDIAIILDGQVIFAPKIVELDRKHRIGANCWGTVDLGKSAAVGGSDVSRPTSDGGANR